MGSGISGPSRRYSSSGIETGSDAVHSQRIPSAEEEVPFTSTEDHNSRRFSQLNFNATKQLEGYGGILTSKTSLVNNETSNQENELEINFQCIPLLGKDLISSTPSSTSSPNRKYRSGSQHFFKFYEIPILEKKNLCQSSHPSASSASSSSITYHLELDISLVDLQYHVADAVLILPENPLEEVEMVAKFFQLDLDDDCSYDFQADFTEFMIPFPAPFTIRQVLTCYLDLMVRFLLCSKIDSL